MNVIRFYDVETDEMMSINAIWEICPDCQGNGYSTLHGLEITNWGEWEDDERDEYFHGTRYRTACLNDDCEQGKTLMPDEYSDPKTLEAYWNNVTRRADELREREQEMRMGC